MPRLSRSLALSLCSEFSRGYDFEEEDDRSGLPAWISYRAQADRGWYGEPSAVDDAIRAAEQAHTEGLGIEGATIAAIEALRSIGVDPQFLSHAIGMMSLSRAGEAPIEGWAPLSCSPMSVTL